MTDISVLKQTICVHLDISRWSGGRCLRDEDLNDATGLPPKDLATRGAMKLCDPDVLAPLSNIKRATERDCEAVCFGFMRGYATYEDNVEALAKQIVNRNSQFDTEKQKLKLALPGAMQDWADLHPDWKKEIEREIPNAPRFVATYEFKARFFRVGAASEAEELNGGLVEVAQGLSGQLFHEIQMEAETAFKRSFENRGLVGQKALRPLHRIQRKLDALRYLDARCGAMIDRIALVLSRLPKTGPIEEPHFSAVVGLFATLGCKNAVLAGVHAPVSLQTPQTDFLDPGTDDDDDQDTTQAPALPSVDPRSVESKLPPKLGPIPAPVAPRAATWI